MELKLAILRNLGENLRTLKVTTELNVSSNSLKTFGNLIGTTFFLIGKMVRAFLTRGFKITNGFIYSPSENGGYCLCVLIADDTPGKHANFQVLYTKPLKNVKTCTDKLKNHNPSNDDSKKKTTHSFCFRSHYITRKSFPIDIRHNEAVNSFKQGYSVPNY